MTLIRISLALLLASSLLAWQEPPQLPSSPMVFGDFTVQFDPQRTFTLSGEGWPSLGGTWSSSGDRVQVRTVPRPGGCAAAGEYRFRLNGTHVTFELIQDTCVARRMILDRSTWRPSTEAAVVPARRLTLTHADRIERLPAAGSATGSWPSFRGPMASGVADGLKLPDHWNAETGENILWRTPIPGLGHSSPIVWGDRIFVTTAISSDPDATFRPGLFGDGDASTDRSSQRWVIYALDRKTGKILWERIAIEGSPVDKRHVKSTYASSTPATDGRIVVAWFGSQGLYAYSVDGQFLWKIDLGHVDVGAYDIPTFEWGPASSPILWNGMVFLQCDTQTDSFLLALNAETGETIWKTERDELPSWGTPTVAVTSSGAELVTNGSNFIRGYDPATGRELWRLAGSSKITAPTPVFGDDLFAVASGRDPERPIFVVRANARGDISLPGGSSRSDAVAWSRTQRGPYMPTPLIYKGLLYILNNNGVFDAYNLKSGEEVYRRRLEHLGSGFSASPVAADGKIYLAGEDGEIVVIEAGPEPRHIATNSMGELLMATPALSNGVMFVRSAKSLFAVGRK